MSMVEGIGDEVLQFFAIITVVFLALLAWWSTSISEAPLIRTVLILERRSRSRTTNDSSNSQPTIMNNENTIDTGQVSPTGIQELVETENVGNGNNNDDKGENESSSSILLPNSQPQPAAAAAAEQQAVEPGLCSSSEESPELSSQSESSGVPTENTELPAAPADSDSSVLRRRRLAFFQSRGPTLLDSSGSSDGNSETPESTPTGNEEQQEATVEESNADQIRIRLKYLNDDQIVVEGRLQEQLGDFKRRHFRIELAAEKMVRLIFNGQVLQSDSQTLQGYGLFDNCVVHCLVHNQRNNSPRAAQTQTNSSANQSTPPDWNLGVVLYTCLSIIIGFAWYCRFQYSHLFTVTTTAALFGLTGMFAVTLLGLYLPDHETIQ